MKNAALLWKDRLEECYERQRGKQLVLGPCMWMQFSESDDTRLTGMISTRIDDLISRSKARRIRSHSLPF